MSTALQKCVSAFKLLFTIFICISCKADNNEPIYYFIGDSIIANWDVEQFFPGCITKNLGRDGIHLTELDTADVTGINTVSIVLIGTNDVQSLALKKNVSQYCDIYEFKISSICCKKIYVLSVLPRKNAHINSFICQLNDSIENRLKKYLNVKFINAFSYFIKANGEYDPQYYRDSIHINEYGYFVLSKVVSSSFE